MEVQTHIMHTASEQASRDPSWPAFLALVWRLENAYDHDTGGWSLEFAREILTGGLPEGMLGMEDELGGVEERGPAYWWHGLRA